MCVYIYIIWNNGLYLLERALKANKSDREKGERETLLGKLEFIPGNDNYLSPKVGLALLNKQSLS